MCMSVDIQPCFRTVHCRAGHVPLHAMAGASCLQLNVIFIVDIVLMIAIIGLGRPAGGLSRDLGAWEPGGLGAWGPVACDGTKSMQAHRKLTR